MGTGPPPGSRRGFQAQPLPEHLPHCVLLPAVGPETAFSQLEVLGCWVRLVPAPLSPSPCHPHIGPQIHTTSWPSNSTSLVRGQTGITNVLQCEAGAVGFSPPSPHGAAPTAQDENLGVTVTRSLFTSQHHSPATPPPVGELSRQHLASMFSPSTPRRPRGGPSPAKWTEPLLVTRPRVPPQSKRSSCGFQTQQPPQAALGPAPAPRLLSSLLLARTFVSEIRKRTRSQYWNRSTPEQLVQSNAAIV